MILRAVRRTAHRHVDGTTSSWVRAPLRRRSRRAPGLTSLVLTAALLAASPARADSTAEACASAAEEGEELKKTGRLLEANDLLVRCVAEECPRVVRSLCGILLEDVQRTLPSIVVKVRDDGGRDVDEARIWVDGSSKAFSTNGHPIPVDPGPHKVSVEWRGKRLDRDVVLTAGERLREIPFRFTNDSRPPTSKPGPIAAIVTTGVAALGLGLFAYLGASASNELDRMRRDCAPLCPADDVDRARGLALAADVSLGVGTVALGLAAWLWVSHIRDHGRSGARPAALLQTPLGNVR